MKNEATTDIFPDIHEGKETATYADLLEVILRRSASKASDLLYIWPIVQVLREVVIGDPIALTHKQWALIEEKFSKGEWPVADSFCQLAVSLQDEMASS